MIERLADILAVSIYRHAAQPSISIPILKYGLIVVIDTALILALSLTLGGITGKLMETAVGIICFLVLRAISGGYHLNTSTACTILSTFIAVSIPHIPLKESQFEIITLISVLIFIVYSPSNLEKQSRIPSKYYPLLKVISIIMAAGSYLVKMEVVTLAVLIQSLSLIRFKQTRGR